MSKLKIFTMFEAIEANSLSLFLSKSSSDFWVLAGLGVIVVVTVAFVVDWMELEVTSLVQSMKMQGSKRSLGTPPRTKARLEMRISVVFMMILQTELKTWDWVYKIDIIQVFFKFLKIQSWLNNFKRNSFITKFRLMKRESFVSLAFTIQVFLRFMKNCSRLLLEKHLEIGLLWK